VVQDYLKHGKRECRVNTQKEKKKLGVKEGHRHWTVLLGACTRAKDETKKYIPGPLVAELRDGSKDRLRKGLLSLVGSGGGVTGKG